MKQGIKRFFNYARARHQVYLNRTSGLQRPWTKDKILDTYRFTNVFRELDKTTAWFRKHVRDPMRNTSEVMLATVVFRLLNRIEVGEAVFCQTTLERGDLETAFDIFCEEGDVRVLKHFIKRHCGRGPYVTGAYIISSPPGYSKLDGMMRIIGGFNKKSGWRHVADNLLENRQQKLGNKLEDTWEWLREQPYFGPFHSYEMVTDLRHTALLDRAPDIMTWCNVGPGARRGLNRVMGRDKRDKSLTQHEMRQEMSDILWHANNVGECWPLPDTPSCGEGSFDARTRHQIERDWPRWEMRDVEHTLCEFDKYERVRLGEGKPRGVYR